MNIYFQEIKSLMKSTVIWVISLAGLIIFFLALYPGIAKDADKMKAIFENYPPEVLKALGTAVGLITSMNGFYAFCFIYVNLCVAIQAMKYGIEVLSKESAGKTCDFIFVKPVSRNSVLASKLGAVFTSLLFTDIVLSLVAVIGAKLTAVTEFDMETFLLITASMTFIQMIFATLGFLIAALSKRIRAATPLALGIVIAFFALSLIVNISGDKKMEYLSPLTYFNGNYIIEKGHYDYSMLVCAVIEVLVFVAASFLYYKKKDIHSA